MAVQNCHAARGQLRIDHLHIYTVACDVGGAVCKVGLKFFFFKEDTTTPSSKFAKGLKKKTTELIRNQF
jgi:hypothetical protein